MSALLLNIAVAAVAVAVIIGGWAAVHLFATRRMGERKLGCRGPTQDSAGNSLCCKGDGSRCESEDASGQHGVTQG